MRTLRASVLALALASSTYAGEMQFPVAPPPPPPSAPAQATTEGVIECPLTEIILTLLSLL